MQNNTNAVMKIAKSPSQRIAEATLGGPAFRLEICMCTQTVTWALIANPAKTITL